MGKKVFQAAEKTSKTLEKNKFNSMIKVLKPKVYITDIASFKGLVHQLTKNGAIIGTDSNPSSTEIGAVNRVLQPVVIPVVDERIPIINIDDQDVILAWEKDHLLLDNDALALLDCFHSWNDQTSTSSGVDEGRMQAVLEEISACVGEGNWKTQEINEQLSDDSCFFKQTSPRFDRRNPEMTAWEEDQQYDMGWLAFQEVESWLLDSDQQQPFPPCGGQMQIHSCTKLLTYQPAGCNSV